MVLTASVQPVPHRNRVPPPTPPACPLSPKPEKKTLSSSELKKAGAGGGLGEAGLDPTGRAPAGFSLCQQGIHYFETLDFLLEFPLGHIVTTPKGDLGLLGH